MKRVKELVSLHGERSSRTPTPFTSPTNDLLRAFKIAASAQQDWKKTVAAKIKVLIVDPAKLLPGTCVSYERLRGCLSLGDASLLKREYLVWGPVPAAAIDSSWLWDNAGEKLDAVRQAINDEGFQFKPQNSRP
jgi:hypothetical protein